MAAVLGTLVLRALCLPDAGYARGEHLDWLSGHILGALWIPAFDQLSEHQLQIFAFGFSLPLAIMALISGEIAKRYGAAYTGLYGGLAIANPRLTGVLVMSVFCCYCNTNLPNLAMLHTLVFVTTLTIHLARDDLGHLELVCRSLTTRSYRWACQLALPSRLICWHDMGLCPLLLGALAILGLIYTGNLS